MSEFLILVVEDSPALRILAKRQLSILGYASEAVCSGEEAVSRVRRADISLILMDIGLPGIDGGQATLLIREEEQSDKRKRVPIIALTAHFDKQRCAACGMDDFLQKPALMDGIGAMLNKWLPAIEGSVQANKVKQVK